MFFRSAYGRHEDAPHSLVDNILGNIGQPLGVGDEDMSSEENEEGNEVDGLSLGGEGPNAELPRMI